jgi:hypothetical protein
MTVRSNRSAPRVAGSLLICSLLSGTALAQAQEPDGAADAPSAPSGALAPTDAADAPKDDEEAAEEAKKAKAEAVPAAAATPAPPPAEVGKGGSSETTIPLEVLPGSAYPAPRVRGLQGGSMWLNMQGYQWPYLPAVPGGSALRVGFSGSLWSDTSYRSVDSGIQGSGDASVHEWRQKSRMVLRLTPTFNAGNGWFAQAQGEVALSGSLPERNELIADDVYARVGKWNVADLTVGRFQAWEIYHFGMALDLNTVEREGATTEMTQPVGIYGVTTLWDRPSSPGYAAIHAYPTDFLRFEVLGEVGRSSTNNQLGVRPTGILDLGFLKLKGGVEYEKQTPVVQGGPKNSRRTWGYGGSLQFVFDPYIEFGVSAAQQVLDVYTNQGIYDAGQSATTTSVGGFANGRIVGPLLLGVGGHFTTTHNLKINATTRENDIKEHTQLFAALQYTFWERFYVKGVFSYADAHYNPLSDPPPRNAYHNKMLSGRVRFMILF